MRVLQQNGVRPRWSPSGDLIVFDRKNSDGYYDVYLTGLDGVVVRSLTENRKGIGQRNNGNAVFHPSGAYVVFLSEENGHLNMHFKWQADPGIGLFCNLYATTPSGEGFWKLTRLPIKRTLRDSTPAMAIVNPVFSRDGTRLYWTERYAPGGKNNWGKWRIKVADFVVENDRPALKNERTLFTPRKGDYATAMGVLDPHHLLISGNLDGQHEYGMDEYRFDLKSEEFSNLTETPQFWEEGAAVTGDGKHIAYMSNATSRYRYDFDDPSWHLQPTEREYWLMRADGSNKERLTYFNEAKAPEYLGRRVIVAACNFSPNGAYLAGSLGVDFGTETKADLRMKIILIELASPL